MLTKNNVVAQKMRMERLSIIRERHNRLIVKQRQEIGQEVVDDPDDEVYVVEVDAGELDEFTDVDE